MHLKTWFDPNEQHVGFQINEGEKAWAHLTLELPEFQGLMRDLAGLRTKFTEQVPEAVDPGSRLDVLTDPLWQVRGAPSGFPEGTALLLLRHQGHGWLGFAVRRDEARAMGEALLRAADAPPPR